MNLQYINLEQRTPAWLAWREGRRMASETPALLGLSKYGVKSPMDLWRAKVTGESPPVDDFVIRARKHGMRHEPTALALASKALGVEFDSGCYERGPWASSFDGIAVDLGEDRADCIVEIKCPVQGTRSTRWKAAVEGRVREDDMAQIQHQLIVSRARRAYYAVYVPGETMQMVPVDADSALQATIVGSWDAFWPSIETCTPPDSSEPVARNDEEWAQATAAYRMAKYAADGAAKVLKAAEEAVRALAGETSVAGAGLTLTRYWAKGNVDYAAVEALRGVDLNPYRKAGAWRTRITTEKEKKSV